MVDEGRRGFFSSLFKRESYSSDTKKEKEQKKQPPEDTGDQEVEDYEQELSASQKSRRRFLKGLGAGGVVVATGVAGRAAERAWTNSKEAQELEIKREVAKNKIEDFMERFNSFRSELKESVDPNPRHRTLEEQDLAHDRFMEMFGDDIPDILDSAHFLEDAESMQKMYEGMRNYDGLSLYYGFMTGKKGKELRYAHLGSAWRRDRPKVRASEFLPEGNQIYNSDIDPRLGQLQSSKYYDPSTVRGSLKRSPGWASIERRNQFRALIDHSPTRELFQATDCSLAEVYSYVKSAIKNVGEDVEAQSAEVRELLEAREKFKKKVLIGSEVESFVSFTHHEDGFSGYTPRELGVIADSGESATKVEQVQGKKFDLQGNLDAVRKGIEDSTGETVIYLNSHGNDDGVSVGGEAYNKDDPRLTVELLAESFMKRIENSMENTLANITLFLDSCHSYNFTKKLMIEISKQYAAAHGGSTEGLHLPTVITAAQEGSVSYKKGFTDALGENMHAIRKEGGLTGAMLLRRIQSEVYHYGDVTMFAEGGRPGQEQGWKELAAAEVSSGTMSA